MAYLSQNEMEKMGFRFLGRGVKISDKASIYNPEKISIGDESRIDDFCVVSGFVEIGKYCHITPMCLVAGGEPGIIMSDFVTLAYGVKVFSQSDDYSGKSLVNSNIPKKFKHEKFARVIINKHVVIGTNAVVFPGVTIDEGCSIGAMSLVIKSTNSWGIYFGTPAIRRSERSKNLLALEKEFLSDLKK
ncbi:acyltransferase [Alishewanella tabrizica]|uniref:Chloramphenicol acetyltransferase n=1 Tax=Alishewanella tabrizica TaxID=671278 RepID=A0ABQ2WK18_9ALTE|nr:acyltransferase [Alishewanella tabrizica]GGW58841.1 galactoside O-acetyltransferase [Alishewanella tabrizica]